VRRDANRLDSPKYRVVEVLLTKQLMVVSGSAFALRRLPQPLSPASATPPNMADH
jgi:hypothetical protein